MGILGVIERRTVVGPLVKGVVAKQSSAATEDRWGFLKSTRNWDSCFILCFSMLALPLIDHSLVPKDFEGIEKTIHRGPDTSQPGSFIRPLCHGDRHFLHVDIRCFGSL